MGIDGQARDERRSEIGELAFLEDLPLANVGTIEKISEARALEPASELLAVPESAILGARPVVEEELDEFWFDPPQPRDAVRSHRLGGVIVDAKAVFVRAFELARKGLEGSVEGSVGLRDECPQDVTRGREGVAPRDADQRLPFANAGDDQLRLGAHITAQPPYRTLGLERHVLPQ